MSKRKYKRGKPIGSIDELLECDYVYIFGDRPKHISFVLSLQLRVVDQSIKRNGVYKAVPIEEAVTDG